MSNLFNDRSLPPYYQSLPKKRMGAGCLFFDEQGRVMLVRPTYKPTWEIPGGVVELNESPRECCRREVQEEIGLERNIGDLLVVDYNHPTEAKTESLMFIFHGGVLSAAEVTGIQLSRNEICEAAFFTEETLPADMTPSLRRRVLAAWRQAKTGKCIYLDDQE